MAISADALETIIETLVENSRQAGASHCEIGISREGPFALVRVADNGAGVPPEDRDRIFEPFFTGRRETGGTGLGLPIVRSLLGTIGGGIRLALVLSQGVPLAPSLCAGEGEWVGVRGRG